MVSAEFEYVLGIKFVTKGYSQALSLIRDGGLMVVPAAPALANIDNDLLYYWTLINADFAIPDSFLMVVLHKIMNPSSRLERLSGYKFLEMFLKEGFVREAKLFLVDPNERESRLNHSFLKSLGIKIGEDDHYIAPLYNPKSLVRDEVLLEKVERSRPDFVVINLGGGTQEKVGYFLRFSLSYTPGIICTGAAISFLTGAQAPISRVVDALYLGWLARCIHDPGKFIKRYIKAMKLIGIQLRNGSQFSRRSI